MGYGLKYYKNFTRDGQLVSLRLYRKNTTGSLETAREIGDFQSLSLTINAEHAGIDEAIHKSTAVFSMVDSVDKTSTNKIKFGGWEELYTLDATEWQVEIQVGGVAVWTGYITPDSWEDDLVYRGTISITARDNIGHMADIDFNIEDITAAGGTVSNDMARVIDIIGGGLTAAGVAMDLDTPEEGNAHWLKYNNQLMYNWMIDTRGFAGKTWYQVAESIMVALGLTLRVGSTNRIILAPFRNLPLCGGRSKTGVSKKMPAFINQSGHRSLSPAYKKIAESCSYEAVDAYIDTFPASAFSGGVCVKDGWNNATAIKQYTLNNPYGDEIGGGTKYAMMDVASSIDDIVMSRRTVNIANRTKVDISFEVAHSFEDDGYSTNVIPSGLKAVAALEWHTGTNNSLVYYWDFANSEWSSTYKYMEANTEEGATRETVNIEATTPNDKGRLVVGIGLYTTFEFENAQRVRFGNFTISVDSSSFPSKVNVNTHYLDKYSMVLNRSTDFAQCPSWMMSAGSIVNGFYLNDAANYYPPIKNCIWDDTSVALPLAVHVHMQLIALHAKPNNILSGDILDATSNTPNFNSIWQLYGRNFILNAGTFNLLNGFVYDVQLVEFDYWEDVCGSMSADFQYNDDTYQASAVSSSSGITAQGGGSGGGGITLAELQAYLTTNHYINNLTAADITGALGFTPANASAIKAAEWNAAAEKAHEHDNKTALDDIESVDISSWNEAAVKSHEHSNKAVLDGITSTKVKNWNYASGTSHTHTNKEALDSLTMNDVTNARTAYNNTHTHSNKSTIDGITSAKVAAWDDAASKAHTHTNKGVLDGIDADDISNWNAIADKALTKEAADKLYQPIGGGGSGIFVCTYGTSTYAAVESAYRTSTVICDKSGCALPLAKVDSDDNFYFKGFCGDKVTTAKLTASSNWSYTETEPGDTDFYTVNYAGVTEQDLDTAYSAGKKLICKKDNGYFFLTKKGSAGYYFGGTVGNKVITIICGSLGWSYTETAIPQEEQAYYCEVAETTYAQAMAAYNAGKILFAHDGHTNICMLADMGTVDGHDALIFCGFLPNKSVTRYAICDDDEWRNY